MRIFILAFWLICFVGNTAFILIGDIPIISALAAVGSLLAISYYARSNDA